MINKITSVISRLQLFVLFVLSFPQMVIHFCRKPVYVMGSEYCRWKLSDFHKSLRNRGVVRPFTGTEDVSNLTICVINSPNIDNMMRSFEEEIRMGYWYITNACPCFQLILLFWLFLFYSISRYRKAGVILRLMTLQKQSLRCMKHLLSVDGDCGHEEAVYCHFKHVVLSDIGRKIHL